VCENVRRPVSVEHEARRSTVLLCDEADRRRRQAVILEEVEEAHGPHGVLGPAAGFPGAHSVKAAKIQRVAVLADFPLARPFAAPQVLPAKHGTTHALFFAVAHEVIVARAESRVVQQLVQDALDGRAPLVPVPHDNSGFGTKPNFSVLGAEVAASAQINCLIC
jgi:hypothetical protein